VVWVDLTIKWLDFQLFEPDKFEAVGAKESGLNEPLKLQSLKIRGYEKLCQAKIAAIGYY
jgi:hypothetical protein